MLKLTVDHALPMLSVKTGYRGSISCFFRECDIRVDFFRNQKPKIFVDSVRHTDPLPSVTREIHARAKLIGWVNPRV